MEEWRDIPGYEGIFQVSNKGRIKSLERTVEDVFKGKKRIRPIKETILKVYENSNGHLRVELHYNNTRKRIFLHQLVAQLFIPNPNNYTVVHHIDHNPENNRVENLEWISDEEHRSMHAIEQNSKPVYQYTLDNKLVKKWSSEAEARRNGYNNISKCYNTNKTVKGFRWRNAPL